jgi:hypothetical protein
MALAPDGAPSVEVTEEQLWQHVVLEDREHRFTSLEAVLAAAHVLGGVHRTTPKNDKEHRIAELEERIATLQTPLPLYAVRDLGSVILAGLLPLAKQIAARYS